MERRKPASRGGFVLGTIAGIAAGVAGGTVLLRRSAPAGDTRPPSATGAGAPSSGAQRAAPDPVQSFITTLKQRWESALKAGKEAADERAAELQLQLTQERREAVVVLDAKLDEAMGEIEPPPDNIGNAPAR